MTTIHVIGNGDMAPMYKQAKGIKITCNMPPFEVRDVYGTCMVDFKMMKALYEGSVRLDMYDWILGARPKKWTEMQPNFYMKYAKNIKDFYLHLPDYVNNFTDFNCGHMAVHYSANKLKGSQIHMYGFDSIFSMNLRSYSDLFLHSDRSPMNSHRLNTNWRPIWSNMFKEFPDTEFIIYHKTVDPKIILPENVRIDTSRSKK